MYFEKRGSTTEMTTKMNEFLEQHQLSKDKVIVCKEQNMKYNVNENGKDQLYRRMVKLELAESCGQYGYEKIPNEIAERLGWLTEVQCPEAKALLDKELANYLVNKFGIEEADKCKAWYEVRIEEEKYVPAN